MFRANLLKTRQDTRELVRERKNVEQENWNTNGPEKEQVIETDKVQKKVPEDKDMTVAKQKVAEKDYKETEPRRYNTEGADKVQKKAPEDKNMTVP